MTENRPKLTAPTRVVCEMLGLSQQRHQQLYDAGKLPPPIDGEVDVVESVKAYVAILKRDDPAKQARASLEAARQRDLEARTKIRLGETVNTADAENVIRQLFYFVQKEMNGLGRFMVRDVREMNQYETYTNNVMRHAGMRLDICITRLKSGHKDPAGAIFQRGAVYGPGGAFGAGTKHRGAFDYDGE
jgi:hypothetical protein